MANIEISLEEIKAHLNVDHDYDDSLIESYKAAALEVAQRHIGKTFADEETDKTIPFYHSIKIGCLMYIAYLYANREAVTDSPTIMRPVPMGISALWEVYREPCAY